MARHAEKVFNTPEEIARIEQLICALPSQARVRVTMCDGDVFSGTVTERPVIQIFEDRRGDPGINAIVRLDDPGVPPWDVYLWLGDVRRVERLDPPSH